MKNLRQARPAVRSPATASGIGRRSPAARLGGAALALVAAAACSAAGLELGDPAVPPWLRETGFEGRAEWSSTLLHRSRADLPASTRLTTLLRGVPGVVVANPQGDGWGLQRRWTDDTACDVPVYLNGARVGRRTFGGSWTLDFLVPPEGLDGVELHAGMEGPVLDETGCGALLLWSERSRVEADEPFVGRIEGSFWGDDAEAVTEVRLEPGGLQASFDRAGTFLFRGVVPGTYTVVVSTPAGELARQRVRVYAHADSRIDVLLERRRLPPHPA